MMMMMMIQSIMMRTPNNDPLSIEIILIRLEEDLRWVDVECSAENRQGSASGKMRGHAHFLPQSVEVHFHF